ncbi:hypothetical protein Rsub_02812 [Raphidocelis subcapitata]|uniref:Uncharacterized protein n=1 Tax=Raphidocelis subcapitata TaxID=307507 RepID=A0A2V0NR37_9CHLO|nr:hypothetical protein Rsub_02812 [Raphidocelis subcapitata]|eukprot:GBF90104.1 hypothetical protein Rsub_02812 [Raphidocelis subcapitata]
MDSGEPLSVGGGGAPCDGASWASRSEPLPLLRGSSTASTGVGDDPLSAHMVLLDIDDGDEAGGGGSSGCSSPGRSGAAAEAGGAPPRRGRAAIPATPTGFTPAEVPLVPAAGARPNAKANRGCGLVVMATSGGAAAAIDGLHRRYTWEGLAAPMVVERCCAARLGVKAATQQASRARRTALAAAARRAVRAGASWHGATAVSAALLAQQCASAPLAGFNMPPGLGVAGFSAPLSMPVGGGHAGSANGASGPLSMMHAGAYGLDGGASHSTPLPLVRAASASAASLAYPMSGPVPHPPGLVAYGQGAGSVYGSSPYSGSPPDAAALGLPPSSAAPSAHVAASQPPPDASLCALSLATQEQVAIVAGHAAALSALSGAAFWLAPGASGCGGAGAPGLALSGSAAQVEAAADLVGQLLAMRGATVPAAACWP